MNRLTDRNEYGEAFLKAGVYIPDVIDKLCAYEDIGLDPEEAGISVYVMKEIPEDKLAEIAEAFKNSRLVIKPEPPLDTCGTCMHFKRSGNTAHGNCDCRFMSVWNITRKEYDTFPLYVVQSRKRCKDDYLSIRGREDCNHDFPR